MGSGKNARGRKNQAERNTGARKGGSSSAASAQSQPRIYSKKNGPTAADIPGDNEAADWLMQLKAPVKMASPVVDEEAQRQKRLDDWVRGENARFQERHIDGVWGSIPLLVYLHLLTFFS